MIRLLTFQRNFPSEKSILLAKLEERGHLNLWGVKRALFSFFLLCFLFLNSLLCASYQYDLCICSVFQNEAPYMKEWIEFHKLMGVQHFYLYNNLSQDDYLTVLKPYIENGEVELVEWPFEGTNEQNWVEIQRAALNDATKIACGKTKWLSVLDLDEFLFPVHAENLITFLKDYEDCAGITINWQHYGTSYVKSIPENKLMIETLLLRAPRYYHWNSFIKSIIRPEYAEDWSSVHHVDYKSGYSQVNSDKVPFYGMWAPYIVADKIRINHYWVRDEYYFLNVKVPRRAKWGVNYAEMMRRVEEMNKEKDEVLLKFVPELRRKLGYDKPGQ